MKAAAFLLLGILSLCAGCDSISDASQSVKQQWEARSAGKTRVFQADKRTVFQAARSSAQKLGFHLIHGGPAQGTFEAITAVSTDTMHGTRQVRMLVDLSPSGDGTAVNVKLTEVTEDDSFNRGSDTATESPLRDTPYYEVFFRQIGDALKAPAK